MKIPFARAALAMLAVLTGLAAASLWRDRHNRLLDYPELLSSKARLGLGVNGAQSFLRAPVTLAGGALNLAAWHGHQEIEVDRAWPAVPELAVRARAEEEGELSLVFWPQKGGDATVLRLSSRASRPSAWLRVDRDGMFTSRTPIAYVLPARRWIRIELRPEGRELRVFAGGVALPAFPAPEAPLRFRIRGDSEGAALKISDVELRSGSQTLSLSFAGPMPWALFLVVTVLVSLGFHLAERRLGAAPACFGALAFFLLLSAGLAFYKTSLASRYPLEVDLRGVPSRIETRSEALARLSKIPPSGRPVLLWLGGSHAWGAGASAFGKRSFDLLRERVGAKSGLDWINGAISAARVADQAEVFRLVSSRRKVAVVALLAGVNDAANEAYPADLEAFAKVVQESGARLLMIPEPSEPPVHAGVARRQEQSLEVAKRLGLASLPLQPFFDARADAGFLWWDFAHLTDAGARAEADALGAPLAEALGF